MTLRPPEDIVAARPDGAVAFAGDEGNLMLQDGAKAVFRGGVDSESGDFDVFQHDLVNDGPLVIPDDRVDEIRDLLGDETDLPILSSVEYNERIHEGETPYDWEAMSRAESGDDWDPQINEQPLRKDDLSELLGWQEEDKPSGYELPDVFDDEAAMDAVEEMYSEQFRNDPLRE